jgi:L-fuconate dehydratase
MKKLEPLKPWFIEEPTAPDDVVGHAAIRKALKPHDIGVATGEHAHNRVSPLPSPLCSTASMMVLLTLASR